MEGEEELEGDPALLCGREEGARADAVVQAVLHVLPHEEAGAVGELKELISIVTCKSGVTMYFHLREQIYIHSNCA